MRLRIELEVELPAVRATDQEIDEYLKFHFHYGMGALPLANPLCEEAPPDTHEITWSEI